MIMVDVATVARWTGGQAAGKAADVRIRGVGTDSRQMLDGRLFIALRGDNHDGHDYAAEAVRQGAVAVLAERTLDVAAPVVVVEDARRALGRLGARWRARFSLPVIAVTGSNGKTTVKECIAAVLREGGMALATRGNLNNDIGVPLMLCEIAEHHAGAVFELGANHAGEIDYLAQLVCPDAGVITNIAPAHLEGFGSLEGVARAKGELFAALRPGGTAVYAGESDWCPLWRELAAHCRQLRFTAEAGQSADIQVRGLEDGRIALQIGDEERIAGFGLAGKHNLHNAAAAAAGCHAAGIAIDTIAAGLERVQPVPGRLVRHAGPGGSVILDDSYNANPGSFAAALSELATHPGRRWAVVGEMAELGEDTVSAHRTLGADVRRAGVERLWACGPSAGETCAAFGREAEVISDPQALVRQLVDLLEGDVVLLVKGSRSNRLERVVEPLLAACAGADGSGAGRVADGGG